MEIYSHLLFSNLCLLHCLQKVSINQDFTVTDQHKLVEEVGGEAEGEQSLSSENHVMAPAKRRSAGFVKKESDPIVFLKSAMRTRGSGRARSEANAVQWRTFGFDVIVRGGGIDKEAESIENDQELIKPLKLGGQAAAAESCQSRGWSRIRTSCYDGRNDCA